MTINISKLISFMQVFVLNGTFDEKNSNSLKVSFELNSINLELSCHFPGSRSRHDSANQTRFRILNQGPTSMTIVEGLDGV